jgi:carbonic anhydrase/acetyltransferase-like protein (isoleucine patch superfamily)
MLHGCTIRENSLVGIGAIILNKALIGKNCLVGAGATVTEGKVIPDGSLVLGVNKIVRQLTPEEIATNTWIAEHYVERAQIYRQGLKSLG